MRHFDTASQACCACEGLGSALQDANYAGLQPDWGGLQVRQMTLPS